MNRTKRRKIATAEARTQTRAARLMQRASGIGFGSRRSAEAATEAMELLLGPDRFRTLARAIARANKRVEAIV